MRNRILESLRRRLERWELDHLRTLAADLDQRLKQAEQDRDTAWDAAEFWKEEAMDLQKSLEDAGLRVGITQDGRMGVIIPSAAMAAEARTA